VLLESSGCGHWREHPEPTTLDLSELGRILDRGGASKSLALQSLAV
jgi:hypothetical protein